MFARTERLILRPIWPEDAESLAQALRDPDVARSIPLSVAEPEPDAAHRLIDQPRDPRLPDFLAFLRTRGAPRLVGGAGLTHGEDGRPELRYWIERSHWGLGFATEATRAVMRIARATGLIGIRAGHYLDSPGSARVLRKLGFRPTGRVEPRLIRTPDTQVPIVEFEYADRPAEDRDDTAAEIYSDKLFRWA
ncbi:MAG: GNAT family N-acetyltransferase [Sphingobium sp.]